MIAGRMCKFHKHSFTGCLDGAIIISKYHQKFHGVLRFKFDTDSAYKKFGVVSKTLVPWYGLRIMLDLERER